MRTGTAFIQPKTEMMEYTYQSIKNLLVDSRVEGTAMHCRFRIPESGEEIESKSIIKKSNSVKNQMVSSVKNSLAREVRRSVFGLIRNTLGYGTVGRITSTVATSVLSQSSQGAAGFSSEDKEAAIVEAFRVVASRFTYDSSNGEWKGAGQMSGLEEQLANQPLQNKFEEDLLARMIIQLAGADGVFEEAERSFLSEQLGLTDLSIDELFLAEHPVLAVECEEVAEASRPTLFLMAYMAALADNRLDDKEKELLDRYAKMLDLPEEQVSRLASTAKDHILQSILSLRASQEELAALATQFQMEPIEVQRAFVRMKKRNLS